MKRQTKKVKLGVKNDQAFMLRTEITKSHLNNRICQYCGVKTNKVGPSFYCGFNVDLSCDIGSSCKKKSCVSQRSSLNNVLAGLY